MAADYTIVGDTKLDDTGLLTGIANIDAQAGLLGGEFDKLGVLAAAAFSVAAVTAFYSAVSSTVSIITELGAAYEYTSAKASTLFGDVNVDVGKLDESILGLSSSTGLAATAINEALYSALSAGIPATQDMAEATEFLSSSAKLATAGYTDIDTALSATAKTLNAYQYGVEETDRIQKVLIQTQNAGITTVDELGAALSNVTPTAAAMNVSFEQVGASLAGLTAAGVTTSTATTQLKGLIAELGKEGTTASNALAAAADNTEYAGMSFTQMMDAGMDLGQVLGIMADYADSTGVSMLDLFSSIEAGQAALVIDSSDFNSNLQAMSTETDVLSEAYETMTDTFQFQSERLSTSMENIGIAAFSKMETPLKGAMSSAQESVDKLAVSMESGSLGKSVESIGNSLGDLAGVALSIAEVALPPLISGVSFLLKYADEATIAITAFAVALGVSKTISAFSTALSAANKVVLAHEAANRLTTVATYSLGTGLTATQTVVALLTGKLSLATVAQGALTAAMNLNPAVRLATGVAALAGGIYVLATNAASSISSLEVLNNKLKETADSIADMSAATTAAAEAAAYDIDYIAKYKEELDSLVDANGLVTEGYEGRANFLINELAEATGIELELIDGTITGYNELTSAIDETIEKMRAEAILSAYREEYEQALIDQKDAQIALNEAQAEYNNLLSMDDYLATLTRMPETLEAQQRAYDIYTKDYIATLDLAQENYDYYTQSIVGYEEAKTAILQGEYDKVNDLVNSSSIIYANTTEEKKSILAQDLVNEQASLESLKRLRTDANAEEYDARITQAEKMVQAKREELTLLNLAVSEGTPAYTQVSAYLAEAGAAAFDSSGNLTQAAQDKVDEIIAGAGGKELELVDQFAAMAIAAKDAFETDDFKQSGEDVVSGIDAGINNKKSGLFSSISNLASGLISSFNNTLDIRSPSRVFKASGGFVMEGAQLGIEEGAGAVLATVSDTARAITDTFNSEVDALNVGQDFSTGLSIGIDDGSAAIINSMFNITDGLVETAIASVNSMDSQLQDSVGVVNNSTSNTINQNFYAPATSPYAAYRAAWQGG